MDPAALRWLGVKDAAGWKPFEIEWARCAHEPPRCTTPCEVVCVLSSVFDSMVQYKKKQYCITPLAMVVTRTKTVLFSIWVTDVLMMKRMDE